MAATSIVRSLFCALYRRYLLFIKGMRAFPDHHKVLMLVLLTGFAFVLFFNNIPPNKETNVLSNDLLLMKDGNEKFSNEKEESSSLPFEENNHKYTLPEKIKLEEGNNAHFFTPRNNSKIVGCYTAGSVHPETGSLSPCYCKDGFYGPHCAIPNVVMTSACQSLNDCEGITARSKPRRVIHFFNFHHELDHAEVRLGELADVVDVFVIGESNRTTSGEPNELLLLSKMKNEGFLKKYHSKILYVMIPSTAFPKDPKKGGWISDVFIRNYLGKEGLSRIEGLQDDDLILNTDADEIISANVIQFLKLHDGYPEPIRLNLRESEYGYFWMRKNTGPDGSYRHFCMNLKVACTAGMLRQVYDNRLMLLRRGWDDWTPDIHAKNIQMIKDGTIKYSQDGKHNVSDSFSIGRCENNYAGYHCTWCFKPEGIRSKWVAANLDEFSDWGPNKEKLDLKNIAAGVKRGTIFGTPNIGLYQVKPAFEGDTNFAPAYVWKNKEKFAYLLYPDVQA